MYKSFDCGILFVGQALRISFQIRQGTEMLDANNIIKTAKRVVSFVLATSAWLAAMLFVFALAKRF
jgi:hypothetical protein